MIERLAASARLKGSSQSTKFPTGDPLIDDLSIFCAARLANLHSPRQPRTPSLAEDWWVVDRLAEGRLFPMPKLPAEQGLRWAWRWARDMAVERGRSTEGAADLLLHQMTELMPLILSHAPPPESKP